MILKWYEMSCDHCGSSDYYRHNIANAEMNARKNGWIISKSKNHFCCLKCLNSYEEVLKAKKIIK